MKIKKFMQLEDEQLIKEENEVTSLLQDGNFIAGIATIATFLGTAGVALLKELKGKSKEEQKKYLTELREKLNEVTGAD